jgi:hypothetical protein
MRLPESDQPDIEGKFSETIRTKVLVCARRFAPSDPVHNLCTSVDAILGSTEDSEA